MTEKKIECLCGKKYGENILKKHIKECALFRKKFELFDFKISKLLQQILFEKKNLFLVRFLFKRYIKIINHKIKEDENTNNTNTIINDYEYEETKTPENTKDGHSNTNNYKPIFLEQNKFKTNEEIVPFHNLNESRNNISVLNKITDFNEVKNKMEINLSKNKKNKENDKNNYNNNPKNYFSNFSNLFKKFYNNNNNGTLCQFCKNRIENKGECHNLTCKEYYKFSCKKKLSCGHKCLGVNNEKYCPPCLEPKCINYSGLFNQNKDTCCQLCLEKLSSSPIVNLTCNHYIHYLCIINRLNEGQNLFGKKLSFNFIKCPVCDQIFECPSVPEVQNKIEIYKKIYFKVGELIKLRLSYDKIIPNEQDPYTLYTFFLCHKCKQPYYVGKSHNNNENSIFGNIEDCLCGKDSFVCNAKGGSFCEKHGFKFFEYKCRFCCKYASRFYSKIHFCEDCYANKDSYNNNFSKLIKNCNINICEFKGIHAPNGTEYCLGCFACRIENIKKDIQNQIKM